MSTDLSHYLGMLRRHWWVLLLVTTLGVTAAGQFTRAQPKVYRSTTSVLVQPAGLDTNVTGGRTKGDINLDTEAQLVKSTAVAMGAAKLLRSTTPPDALARAVAVEVPANTSVLVVAFEAGTPQSAQAGSHAFAEAYLRNREDSARAQLDAQISALNSKIRQLTLHLTNINNQLARADRNSPQRPNLESRRSTAQNQLNGLSGKFNELTTATVTAGQIISDARLPEKPSSPNPPLNLATGGMVGFLLALGLALLRERLDRRIRTAADVRHRGRIGVLATLDERTAPRLDDLLQPYGPGGRIFNRLRNEVLASLGRQDQIIVVTGACRGAATTLVAANLAAALARTGSDVVLVGAHLPDSVTDPAPLARIVGVAATPGLSDLLAGRIRLAEAMQQAPRVPSLRVITTGGAATAGGLMQSQRLRDTLDALRRQTGYIVIEAPSTTSSADAQSLASLADAAILAVELRRSKRPALLDAGEQLRRVGTPLLGAVVLPRLAAGGRRTEQQPHAVSLAPEPGEQPARRDTAGESNVGLSNAGLDDAERTQPLRIAVGNQGSTQTRPPRPTRSGAGGETGRDEATDVIDLAGMSTGDRGRPGDGRLGESR